MKIDTDGNFVWGITGGGIGYDTGNGICTDSFNNIYLSGSFSYSITLGSMTLMTNESPDFFIAKLDAQGNWLWANIAGGDSYSAGGKICTDTNQNLYVTGTFSGEATFGSFPLVSSGLSDIFLAKLDPVGNWEWAQKAGGSYYDWSNDLYRFFQQYLDVTVLIVMGRARV